MPDALDDYETRCDACRCLCDLCACLDLDEDDG